MRKQLMIGLILIALIASISVASAARTGPTDYWNNENCRQIGCLGLQFKIDASDTNIESLVGTETFTYSDGFQVTVTVQAKNPGPFDVTKDEKLVTWTSNWPVSAVITKDGGGMHVYAYRYDAETSDLLSPSNYGGVEIPENAAGNHGAISHLIFCYTPGDDQQQVPEFPALALPIGMIIGFLGLVLFVKSTKEN